MAEAGEWAVAAFKVSGSDIVEKQSLVQTKQSALALRQGGFDGDPLGMQAIQVAVERIFGEELANLLYIALDIPIARSYLNQLTPLPEYS